MDIFDQAFLVSGAGPGLGAAVAKVFSGLGAKLILADLNREAGEKLATELG